ncbi:MAG: alpha/beta hydrolase [Clostridia bacterium]|nr:alpha/beta hydrolase [Clostridia bacterium]
MKKSIRSIIAFAVASALVLSIFTFAFAAEQATPYDDSLFFEYGEYTIHYRIIRAEEKIGQIFMIHGFALSGYCWTNLAELLSDAGYDCVLADLPDFGYSTRETAETDKLPREEIMHALMLELSSDPWFVAGHSMGGYIALALAQSYPQSVKNLLLYGTAGNSGAGAAVTGLMNNAVFIKVMGGLMERAGRCAPIVRLLLAAALADCSYSRSYDVEKVTDPYRIEGTGAGAIYSFSMLPLTDYDAVSEMPPILFVNGDKDFVITDRARTALRSALPEGSADVVVNGGGHMFIENMADKTAEITLGFLADK